MRRAYFAARANKELVDVARETLDDQNKHLLQVQGMVLAGTQPPIALAQQKAAVADATVQLITSQNGYETSKAQLNQAAGIAGGTDYDVSDHDLEPVADEDQPLETLVAKALVTRPELSVLAKQRQAEEATLSSARGTYGPSVAASAGVTDVGVKLDQLVPNWNAGVGVTWPVFQGGLTRGTRAPGRGRDRELDAQQSVERLRCGSTWIRRALPSGPPRPPLAPSMTPSRVRASSFGSPNSAMQPESETSSNSTMHRSPTRPPPRRSFRHAMDSPQRAHSFSLPWDAHDAKNHPVAVRSTDPPRAKPSSPVTRIVLLVLLVAVVGGSAWLVRARSNASAVAATAASSAAANRVIPVLTTDVVARDVPVTLEGLGTVAAFYTVTVKTQVDGRIDKVLFTEGQKVKKGDVLVQIDPRPFAIQLETAHGNLARDAANYANAKVNAERYKTLSQQNLISMQQFTDQQSMADQLAPRCRAIRLRSTPPSSTSTMRASRPPSTA